MSIFHGIKVYLEDLNFSTGCLPWCPSQFSADFHLIWKLVNVLVPGWRLPQCHSCHTGTSATLFSTFFLWSVCSFFLFLLFIIIRKSKLPLHTFSNSGFFCRSSSRTLSLKTLCPGSARCLLWSFLSSGAPCSPDISYSPSTGPKSSLLLGSSSSSTNALTAGSQFLTRVWGSVLLLRLIRCSHRGL